MPQCNFNPFLFWRGHTGDLHETCPSHTGCCGAANPGTAAVSSLAWHWGWANSASDAPTQQPLQLPPPASNMGKVGNHILETIFYLGLFGFFFPAPSCSLWLSSAPTRTGRFIPHCHHFRGEDQTLTSPVQEGEGFLAG